MNRIRKFNESKENIFNIQKEYINEYLIDIKTHIEDIYDLSIDLDDKDLLNDELRIFNIRSGHRTYSTIFNKNQIYTTEIDKRMNILLSYMKGSILTNEMCLLMEFKLPGKLDIDGDNIFLEKTDDLEEVIYFCKRLKDFGYRCDLDLNSRLTVDNKKRINCLIYFNLEDKSDY
jgi:hypothetical protein